MISSAVTSNVSRYITVQIFSLVIGLIGIAILVAQDYNYLSKFSVYIYILCVVLLVLVLIPGIGASENGARRWIKFNSYIGLQPSEVAKLGFIVTFSTHLSAVNDQLNRPRNVLLLCLHAAGIVGLILLQPDLGTSIQFICMAIAMLFVAGIGMRYILGGAAAAALSFPLLWFFAFKDYQKERILTMLNPEADLLDSGYHVLQSKIAAGSGQITGAGLYNGTSQFSNFLPERHTDFIYAVVGEELGFIGAIFVILLLVAIIMRCLYVSQIARNPLGQYMCTGVATLFIFQTFQNIGMCIGIMPVTGITLPFISYGGSSLLVNLLAIGLVMSVHYRHKIINF